MQYLYGEASPILKLSINNEMKENTALAKELEILRKTIENIDNLPPQAPSQESIDAILNYAKSSGKKNK